MEEACVPSRREPPMEALAMTEEELDKCEFPGQGSVWHNSMIESNYQLIFRHDRVTRTPQTTKCPPRFRPDTSFIFQGMSAMAMRLLALLQQFKTWCPENASYCIGTAEASVREQQPSLLSHECETFSYH